MWIKGQFESFEASGNCDPNEPTCTNLIGLFKDQSTIYKALKRNSVASSNETCHQLNSSNIPSMSGSGVKIQNEIQMKFSNLFPKSTGKGAMLWTSSCSRTSNSNWSEKDLSQTTLETAKALITTSSSSNSSGFQCSKSNFATAINKASFICTRLACKSWCSQSLVYLLSTPICFDAVASAFAFPKMNHSSRDEAACT